MLRHVKLVYCEFVAKCDDVENGDNCKSIYLVFTVRRAGGTFQSAFMNAVLSNYS